MLRMRDFSSFLKKILQNSVHLLHFFNLYGKLIIMQTMHKIH